MSLSLRLIGKEKHLTLYRQHSGNCYNPHFINFDSQFHIFQGDPGVDPYQELYDGPLPTNILQLTKQHLKTMTTLTDNSVHCHAEQLLGCRFCTLEQEKTIIQNLKKLDILHGL